MGLVIISFAIILIISNSVSAIFLLSSKLIWPGCTALLPTTLTKSKAFLIFWLNPFFTNFCMSLLILFPSLPNCFNNSWRASLNSAAAPLGESMNILAASLYIDFISSTIIKTIR